MSQKYLTKAQKSGSLSIISKHSSSRASKPLLSKTDSQSQKGTNNRVVQGGKTVAFAQEPPIDPTIDSDAQKLIPAFIEPHQAMSGPVIFHYEDKSGVMQKTI